MAQADCATVADHPRLAEIDAQARFVPARVVAALQARGINAAFGADAAQIAEDVARRALPGDVVVVLSNGDFDGLVGKLTRALSESAPGARADAAAAPAAPTRLAGPS